MFAPALSPSASLRLPLIERHLSFLKPRSVLEVGCGGGAMAHRLAARYDYRGYEPDRTSFLVASHRVSALGRGEVLNQFLPSSPDRKFDVVVGFEVLEHIDDDVRALSIWTRWLEPYGGLLLSVPAHPSRFGPGDEKAGHFRRYTRASLSAAMQRAGLSRVSIQSWGMPLGFGLEAFRNCVGRWDKTSEDIAKRTARSGRYMQPAGWLGRSIEYAVRPFAALQRPFVNTDLGVGFIAMGRL